MEKHIQIPVAPALKPRQQIMAAIAANTLEPRCERHPDIVLKLRPEETLNHFIKLLNADERRRHASFFDGLRGMTPHLYQTDDEYAACSKCPLHQGKFPYPVGDPILDRRYCPITGLNNRPGPSIPPPILTKHNEFDPDPDQIAVQQFLLSRTQNQPICNYLGNGEPLKRLREVSTTTFNAYDLKLIFEDCPRCFLESRGVLPADSHASFENFVCQSPKLQNHLQACREFAANPTGILILAGTPGNGKSHLALAILAHRVRLGYRNSRFIKHRHFIERYYLDKRPVNFGEEPPESLLRETQEINLLVYDELQAATNHRSIEEPLLDLFERRIGNHLPSIITTNIPHHEFEAVSLNESGSTSVTR